MLHFYQIPPPQLSFSLWFFIPLKSDIDEAAYRMPPLFNPQKRQILFVYQDANQTKPQCPSIMGSNKQNALTFAAYFAFSMGGMGAIGSTHATESWRWIAFWLFIGLFILGLVLLR